MSQQCPVCREGCGIIYEDTGAHLCQTCKGTGRTHAADNPQEGHGLDGLSPIFRVGVLRPADAEDGNRTPEAEGHDHAGTSDLG